MNYKKQIKKQKKLIKKLTAELAIANFKLSLSCVQNMLITTQKSKPNNLKEGGIIQNNKIGGEIVTPPDTKTAIKNINIAINKDRPKNNEGKPDYRLLYTSMLNDVAKVRMHGVKKYGSPTAWMHDNITDYLAAAERHIRKIIDGESLDKDTNIHHAAHAIASLMFVIENYHKEHNNEKL